MAKVRLDFTPPTAPDIAALHIYESVLEEGPYSEIEEVTAIGSYPNYLSYYTTDDAASTTNWFSIAWETTEGIIGEMSAPVKGGTRTLVSEVLARVMLRDPSLNEAIATQSVEFVISQVMQTENPYDDIPVTYRQMEAMTLLSLARASIQTFVISQATSESYTAGLVSQKSGSSETKKALDDLIAYLTAEANRLLGINNSFVFLLPDIDPTGTGNVSAISWDQSRLALTINYE